MIYFSKVFKKNVGITPTAFRRKYRNTGVSTEIAE